MAPPESSPVRHLRAPTIPDRVDARIFADFGPKRVGVPSPIHATFKPEVWDRAQRALIEQGVVAPIEEPAAPPEPTAEVAALQAIQSLLSPDNYQVQNKYLTAQVAAGQAYDYQVPSWTRHFLLTNTDTIDTAPSSYLYYWYDNPQQGSKVLPQNYSTLITGQSISENSEFGWISVYANSGAANQGWELRFSGRPADNVGKTRRTLLAPVAARSPSSVSAPASVPSGVYVPPNQVVTRSPPNPAGNL